MLARIARLAQTRYLIADVSPLRSGREVLWARATAVDLERLSGADWVNAWNNGASNPRILEICVERSSRSRDQVQVSQRVHELLLVSGRSRQPLYLGTGKLFQNAASKVARQLQIRCPSVQRLFASGDAAKGPFCPISAIDHSVSVAAHGGAAADPVDSKWVEWRKEQLGQAWAFPQRLLNCQDMVSECGFHYAEMFGKIDHSFFSAAPNGLYSAALRSAIACTDWTRALLGLPVFRVKSNRWKTIWALPGRTAGVITTPQQILPSPDSPPALVALTLIAEPGPSELNRDQDISAAEKKLQESRKDFLIGMSNAVLGPSENGNGSLNDRYVDSDIELLVSLSAAYPLVAKAVFGSFRDLAVYLDELRHVIPGLDLPTGTLLGVCGRQLVEVEPAEEQELLWGRADAESLTRRFFVEPGTGDELADPHCPAVDVLVRLGGPNQAGILKTIEETLQQGRFCRDPRQGVDDSQGWWFRERTYYWDASLRIRTRQVGRLLHFVSNVIRCIPGVEHTATIPLHEVAKDRLAVQTVPLRQAEPQSPTIKDFRELDFSGEEKLAACTINAPSAPAGDPLVYRIYDLLSRCCWLIRHLEQLRQAWQSDQLLGRQRLPEAPKCFGLSLNILADARRRLEVLSESACKIASGKVEVDKFREEGDSAAETARVWRSALAAVWAGFSVVARRIGEVESVCSVLVTEMNERTEVHQILQISEPVMRVGQQASVMDVAMEAVNRLFRWYCSRPKNNEDNNDSEKWRGVVTTTPGKDFGIRPAFQVLQIPLSSRLNLESKLVLLAHEAGHFILNQFGGELRRLGREFCKEIMEEIYKRASEIAQIGLSKVDLSGKVSLAERWGEGRLVNYYQASLEQGRKFAEEKVRCVDARYAQVADSEGHGLDEYEVLVDLFAGLGGSPAYFRALGRGLWSLGERSGVTDLKYPPAWLRLKFGQLMARKLGWIADGSGDQGAPLDVWEVGEQIDKWVALHCEYGQSLTDGFGTDGWNRTVVLLLDSAEEAALGRGAHLQDGRRRLELLSRLHPSLFVYLALEEDNGRLLWKLVRWLERIAKRFLFYPLPENYGALTDQELRVAHRSTVRWVNNYCQYLAERLMFNDELVLDAPVKYIAAAAELPVASRPVHPSGRVQLSLYYSQANADKWEALFRKADPRDIPGQMRTAAEASEP